MKHINVLIMFTMSKFYFLLNFNLFLFSDSLRAIKHDFCVPRFVFAFERKYRENLDS